MSIGNKIYGLSKDVCFRTNGTLSLAILNSDGEQIGALRPVGTISDFTFSPTSDKLPKKEYQSGGNSIVCIDVISTDVSVSMTFDSIDYENIALLSYADFKTVEEKVALDLTITAKLGGVTKLGHIVKDSTYTVKDVTDTTTYEEGKNFVISNSTIFIFKTAEQTARGATNLIAEDDVLNLVINTTSAQVINAFTNNDLKVTAYFEGLNMANGNKAITIDIPVLQIDPAELNYLVAEEFGTMAVTGQIIKKPELDYLYTVLME